MSNSNTFSRDNKAAKSNKSVAKPKDKVIGSSSTEDWLNDYDYDYVSMMGYRDYSPLRHSSAINIYTPDGTIDMSETGTPLMANGQYLPPYSGIHNMGTQHVREVALAKNGGSLKKYQAGDQVVNLSNQFIYPEQINRFANDALQNRALACQGPDCLAGANTYYNKYVAPKFGLPNTWKLNELYGIVSGDPNQPYGTTADSWDLAALMQAKGAIQNYAAPLYEDDKKTRRDYKDAKRYWNLRSDEEKKNLYSQMALGTLVNFGDYGGLAYGERLQGSNEKAGLYPSRHSARVVGFTETGVPVIYDYGHITRIDDPVFDFPITNVTTPKELAKYNYQYVKDWQDKNKAKLDYDPKEKLLLTKGSQRPGEDPFTEDELKYVEGINKNIANLMQITGASQDDIIKAGKVAFGIMEGETRGGRGAPKAKLKELVKSVTPFTDESSKGLTRIKPEMQAGDETNKYSQYLKALGLNPKDLDLWDPEQAALATTALILSRKGNIEGVDKWYLRAQQHNTPGVGPKNTERLKQADKDYANNVIQNASRLYSTKTGYGLPETEEWMTKKQSERLKKQAEESKKEGAKALSEALKPKAMASESTGYSPKIIPISQLTKKEMGGESNWLDEYDLPKAQLGLELLTVDNQSYDPRGEFSSYTQPGPLAFVYPDNYSEENIRDKPVTKPAPAAERDLVTEPDKPVKKPAEKQYKVKERYQAFFPNPAKISTKAITPATTYVSGKEQNTLSSMPAYKRLLTQAKEAAEIKRINNVLNATANAASFFPGIPGILGNAASAAYNVEDGDYMLGALQMIPDRTSKTISGFNNLISGKELYDFHTQPEPSYGNFLPYLTDEYKRELFKQKPLTVQKDGGWLEEYQTKGEVKPKTKTVVHTDKALFDKAYKAEMDSMNLYNESIKNKLLGQRDSFRDGKYATTNNYSMFFNLPSVFYENAPNDFPNYFDRPKEIYEKMGADGGYKNELFGNQKIKPSHFDRTLIYNTATKDKLVINSAMYKKPVVHNVYQPPIEPPQDTIKPVVAPVNKPIYHPKYNQEIPGIKKSKQNVQVYQYEDGGWLDELDELDEDYRYGGVKRHKKMPRGTTKNLVRGINKLFIPDPKLFGPFGRKVFDPNSKFEDGGWLQDYE